MGGHDNVFQKVVPWSDAAMMELAPGMMFRVSGGHYPAQFIRIVGIETGLIRYEALEADGNIREYATSSSGFSPGGAILKYQAIVPDAQWEAFAVLLNVVSCWHLDRGQIWEMFLWLQDMAIELEMAVLRKRKV